ncbi:M1 aminopeptidase family protein [Tepidimicrobium xylanilyticum]|uniref:hypothetical protein n=1 Tax=Tepidimicrobium xylanilyticum TaxID=1123352 RepID=UPI00264E89C6|nr:hypothetical protein [Tepidimicrobium xylanilyticum]GMG97329.1 membrane protein [Tepidimicrobium xylanilyticum]
MSFFSYLRVETSRIFKSKTTWFFIMLIAATPLIGLTIFKPNNVDTAATQMILNPVVTGTVGGAIFFAVFTLFELNRVDKYKVSMLTYAVASPTILHIAKMGAIFITSIITILFIILIYLPYTFINMKSFFNGELYMWAYLIYMLPSMWIGSLFAAIFYQLSNRLDISFLLFTASVLFSFSDFLTEDFILRWINPNIPVFSDAFGNYRVLRTGLYNRRFWMIFLGGIWIISFLFTRRYEKGIWGSLQYNIRKLHLPVLGICLIILSINIYFKQPFYNSSPPEVDWDKVRNTGLQLLNFQSVTAEVRPDFRRNTIYGKIRYIVDNYISSAEKRMIINSGYELYSIRINGEDIEYTELPDEQFTLKNYQFNMPIGTDMVLEIEYGGYPKLWGAYRTSLGGNEISPKNVELRNHSLIPSLGIYGATVDVSIVLPDTFTLISLDDNIRDIIENNDGTKTWFLSDCYDSVDVYASDYACKSVVADEMTADFYFHENFTELLEEYDAEEVLIDVFNYCTEHYGPLNYLKDKKLILIQTSAFNFGGGATNGVSNMSETTFSIYSLTDPIKGAAGKEILAHEIIHQWWGLNRMIWEDPDVPEWTGEGLTVYSTYRLYKEKYGEEYGQKYYVDQWKAAVKEMKRNFYHRHPEYLDIMPESFAAHLRVRELEIKKYCLMPLKILKAEELIGGEEAMDEVLKKLSSSNQHKQLTFREFLDACGLTKEALEIEKDF